MGFNSGGGGGGGFGSGGGDVDGPQTINGNATINGTITYSSSAGGKIYAHDTGSFVGLQDMGDDGYLYVLSSDHYGIDISGSNADGVSIYGGFGAEAGVSIISTRHAHFNDPDGDPLILTDESGNRSFYGGTVSGSSHFKIGGNLSASNCFYVDRTRERVGVGTSVPTTPLSVIGVISSSACISGSTLQLEALKTNRLFAQVSSSQAYGGGTTVEGGQYWGGDNRISILRTNTTANGTTMHIGAEAGTRILVSGSTQVQCTSQNVTLSADQKIVMQGRVDCNETVSGSSDLKVGGALSASNCFYTERTTERVGIGVNKNMSEKLDVNGNARFRSVGSAASAGALHYTSNGTLTTNTSDERLKDDIVDIDNALEKVVNLRGVYHTWKEDYKGDRVIGSVAQEVNSVVPELAFTNLNTGYMGVHYDRMAPLLIEAIKEQNELIKDLQERIAILEAGE